MEGIKIRKMSRDDISRVWTIGKLCFTTPWQIRSFEYELGNKDAILMVAAADNKITGYICLRTILDITHVMDLAVESGSRRMGIGNMLLGSALQELKRSAPQTHFITLEVRKSNIAAIRLYERSGFKETGRRRGYYQKPLEDAIIMGLDMNRLWVLETAGQ